MEGPASESDRRRGRPKRPRPRKEEERPNRGCRLGSAEGSCSQTSRSGRDEQRTRGVPEPPGVPDRPEILPAGEAGEAETHGTEGRSDEAAREPRAGEPEDVAGALESAAAAREPADQRGGDDRFERVSDGDSERRQGGARRPEVGGERADEDSRPGPGAEEEKRGDRDPGGRPKGCRARVHVRESESDLGRADVYRGERRDDRQPRGDPLRHGSADSTHAARRVGTRSARGEERHNSSHKTTTGGGVGAAACLKDP